VADGRPKPAALKGVSHMQYNCEIEAPQATQDSGASLLEIKKAYEAGLLVTTVTPDMINEQLITAVFEDVQPINDLIH
jgi:hypothetical protein